jgi:hypothetical protein
VATHKGMGAQIRRPVRGRLYFGVMQGRTSHHDINRAGWPRSDYPLPRVLPASDLAGFEDELDASVFPAFDSAAFEGVDDRDALAIRCSFHLKERTDTRNLL